MFVLEIDNNSTYISQGQLTKEQYKLFKRALGYKPETINWIKRQKIEKAKPYQKHAMEIRMAEWDGYFSTVCHSKRTCNCYKKKSPMHFPTGLLGNARKFFEKNNLDYKLVDIRTKPERTGGVEINSEVFEPRDYLIQAKDKACNIGRGLIQMATGAGKTPFAASLIAELNVSPVIFFVTTRDLLFQAKEEFERFLVEDGQPVDIGLVGGGEKKIRNITVMTIQTAIRALGKKYVKFDDEDVEKDETDIEDIKTEIKDLIHSAKLVIQDECHHTACETCQVISDAAYSAYYKFGLSATPRRDQGDDILIDACFGRKIVSVDSSDLIDRGFLVAPEIFFVEVDNTDAMKFKSYAKIYKYGITEHDLRNQYIANMATSFYEKGKQPLVLVKQIAHGKMLEKMIPGSKFIYGGTAKKKRNEHLELMRQKKCGVTISSVIFDEGINVKSLDALILAGSGKSSTRALQRIGRIIRPYPNVAENIKKNPVVVDFYDQAKYVKEHAQARLRIYKKERRFQIKHISLEK